jgi:hypothetical protein
MLNIDTGGDNLFCIVNIAAVNSILELAYSILQLREFRNAFNPDINHFYY